MTDKEKETIQKYADIMEAHRPPLPIKRIQMDLVQRAKIFSSFDALRGYKEAVQYEGWRMERVRKRTLADDEIALVNDVLSVLQRGMNVEVVCFVLDEVCKGIQLGSYCVVSGTVQQIDATFKTIRIAGRDIKFDDIDNIKLKDSYDGQQ